VQAVRSGASFFVEDLRRLYDLTRGGEHGGVGEALLDQLQAQEVVVDTREGGTRDLHHVYLDVLAPEPVHERSEQRGQVFTMVERAIGHVDSEHAESLLLGNGGAVEEWTCTMICDGGSRGRV
jgi:hypothetical protein